MGRYPPRKAASDHRHTYRILIGEQRHRLPYARIPVLFRDLDFINIHALLEPPLILGDLDIIPTHLPLPHTPILCKRPILQSITAFPLHLFMRVLILIPELDGDLVVGECE